MKNILFLIFFFAALCQAATAQVVHTQARIDSMRHKLDYVREDTNKVNLMCFIASDYSYINTNKAFKYANKAVKLAEELNYTNGIAEGCNEMGLAFRDEGHYDKALKYFFHSLELRKGLGSQHNIGGSLCNIGIVYFEQKKYPQALEYLFNAKKMLEGIGDTTFLANTIMDIGIVMYRQENYTEALADFNIAEKMFGYTNDDYRLASCYVNTGEVYRAQKKYAEAKEMYLKGQALADKISYKAGSKYADKCLDKLYKDMGK